MLWSVEERVAGRPSAVGRHDGVNRPGPRNTASWAGPGHAVWDRVPGARGQGGRGRGEWPGP